MPETSSSSYPLLPSPWPPAGPVDLKTLMKQFAPSRPAAGAPTTPGYRRVVRVLEPTIQKITAEPLPASGWLDGIQNRCLLSRSEHRDLTIAYVAAGITDGASTLLHVEERLAVLCSVLDEQLVRRVDPGVPVLALPELEPWNLALATGDWIDATRRGLEFDALVNAAESDGSVLVVDGAIPATTPRTDVIGIVKRALETEWLPDPDLLPADGGWRSPAFLLRGARADQVDILSAYVRLRTAAPSQAWGYSLIRVETLADRGVEVLDAACALAMTQRQPPGAGDSRWEIQPRAIRRTEEILKARCPFAVQHFA